MSVVNVLNEKIDQRGISVSELSRRADLNDELLRRSLNGTRTLKATEFVAICRELELDIDDFTERVGTD